MTEEEYNTAWIEAQYEVMGWWDRDDRWKDVELDRQEIEDTPATLEIGLD